MQSLSDYLVLLMKLLTFEVKIYVIWDMDLGLDDEERV